MITEDYVSYNIAKLLKEKGFDIYCPTAYETMTSEHHVEETAFSDWGKLGQVKRPTLQMAMKWLREIHGLFIHIDVIREASCWLADIQDIKNDVAIYQVKEEFPGYEEACEAAIKYCLKNLI